MPSPEFRLSDQIYDILLSSDQSLTALFHFMPLGLNVLLAFLKFIFCPTLKKTVVVKQEQLSWGSSESPCELCGSHGDIEVDVECQCGKSHTIELHSW